MQWIEEQFDNADGETDHLVLDSPRFRSLSFMAKEQPERRERVSFRAKCDAMRCGISQLKWAQNLQSIEGMGE